MVLINGSEGIGTGYSTSIPSFNPKDIIDYLEKKLKGENPSFNPSPWYNNFKGKISIVACSDLSITADELADYIHALNHVSNDPIYQKQIVNTFFFTNLKSGKKLEDSE